MFADAKALFLKIVVSLETGRPQEETFDTCVAKAVRCINKDKCYNWFIHTKAFYPRCAAGLPIATNDILDKCHDGDEYASLQETTHSFTLFCSKLSSRQS